MESGDGGSESDQLGDLPVQIRQLPGQKVPHMCTGSLASVTDAQDVTDLGQGQPRAPTAANEIQPRHCFVPIGPDPVAQNRRASQTTLSARLLTMLQRNACPLAVTGCWPETGSPVAAYGQFFVTADTRCLGFSIA